MARLRNRIVKAEFWSDEELLRWPLAKRVFYQGLWAIAEDSGCVEGTPFGWKLELFRSPVDADVTETLLSEWRDELIEAQKLIPYQAEGKRLFFLHTFHDHESPRNPQSPSLPLPPWIRCESKVVARKDTGRGGSFAINTYVIDKETLETYLARVNGTVMAPQPDRSGTGTIPEPPSGPDLSGPDLSSTEQRSRAGAREPDDSEGPLSGEPDPVSIGCLDALPKNGDGPDWVAAWVENEQACGREPTKNAKAIFGRKVKEIAGLDPLVMIDALKRMSTEEKQPTLLPYVYEDCRKQAEKEMGMLRAGLVGGRRVR